MGGGDAVTVRPRGPVGEVGAGGEQVDVKQGVA
jgi:hypothetical protein